MSLVSPEYPYAHFESRWKFTRNAVISYTSIVIFYLRSSKYLKIICYFSQICLAAIILIYTSINPEVKLLKQGPDENLCLLWGSFPQNTAPPCGLSAMLVIQVQGLQIRHHLLRLLFLMLGSNVWLQSAGCLDLDPCLLHKLTV